MGKKKNKTNKIEYLFDKFFSEKELSKEAVLEFTLLAHKELKKEKAVKAIQKHIAKTPVLERSDLMYDIIDGYCLYCGDESIGICHCRNDE